MPIPMTPAQILDREFLEMRAKLLELAACLDRLQRGDGPPVQDERTQRIAQGLEILAEGDSGRAERIQNLFSRPYDPDWRRSFEL